MRAVSIRTDEVTILRAGQDEPASISFEEAESFCAATRSAEPVREQAARDLAETVESVHGARE